MGELLNLKDKIKKYYKFSPSEINGLIISILVLAFIVSFREWGRGDQINLGLGLFNLFNAVLLVTLTMLVRESAHRIVALHIGLRAEYKMWTWGLLLGLVFAFISNGQIWMLLPGGILVHHMAGHRLGWFRYGLGYFPMGIISLFAPIANILLVIIFKIINHSINSPLIDKIIVLNIALAVWTMLPIPPMDGCRIFFASRLLYIFSFFSIIAASALLHPYFNINVWLAVIGAILIGVLGWLIYYLFLERFLWQGPAAKMK
jgi:Zn-dependent protease